MFTLTSCMRGDHMVAYFYSFDEESSFRYVQVSKNYLQPDFRIYPKNKVLQINQMRH